MSNLLAFTLLAIAPLSSAASDPTAYVYKVVDGVEIKADVYSPGEDSDEPRPVVAWYHGGALIMGKRGDVPKQLIELCESRRFVLVAFDYRLAPQAQLTDIIEDLTDGLTWIRERGPELFGANPDRIVVGGASAGGYLALMSGVCLEPPPTAIVSFYGFGDIDGKWTTERNANFQAGNRISEQEAWEAVGDRLLTQTNRDNGQGRWKFFVYLKQTGLWTKTVSGFDPKSEQDKLTPFCPIRNLSDDFPPLLMVHGTADRDVPYQKSVEMAEALKRIDRPHELITVVDGRHGLWGGDPEKVLESVERALQFIAEQLSD